MNWGASQGQERPYSPRLVIGVCFKEAGVHKQLQVWKSNFSQGKRTTELRYPQFLISTLFPNLKIKTCKKKKRGKKIQNQSSHSKFSLCLLVICRLKLRICFDKRNILRAHVKFSPWSQLVIGLTAVKNMGGTRATGFSRSESQTFQRHSLTPQAEPKLSLPEVLVIN